jgi:hypothetical protein
LMINRIAIFFVFFLFNGCGLYQYHMANDKPHAVVTNKAGYQSIRCAPIQYIQAIEDRVSLLDYPNKDKCTQSTEFKEQKTKLKKDRPKFIMRKKQRDIVKYQKAVDHKYDLAVIADWFITDIAGTKPDFKQDGLRLSVGYHHSKFTYILGYKFSKYERDTGATLAIDSSTEWHKTIIDGSEVLIGAKYLLYNHKFRTLVRLFATYGRGNADLNYTSGTGSRIPDNELKRDLGYNYFDIGTEFIGPLSEHGGYIQLGIFYWIITYSNKDLPIESHDHKMTFAFPTFLLGLGCFI